MIWRRTIPGQMMGWTTSVCQHGQGMHLGCPWEDTPGRGTRALREKHVAPTAWAPRRRGRQRFQESPALSRGRKCPIGRSLKRDKLHLQGMGHPDNQPSRCPQATTHSDQELVPVPALSSPHARHGGKQQPPMRLANLTASTAQLSSAWGCSSWLRPPMRPTGSSAHPAPVGSSCTQTPECTDPRCTTVPAPQWDLLVLVPAALRGSDP